MTKNRAEKRLINKKTISSSLKDFLPSCQAALFLLSLLLFPLLYDTFSFPKKISAPLLEQTAPFLSEKARLALDQPYYFLGNGKQSLAFVSQDGNWVIKFFNRNYFEVPFYARHSQKEWAKRKKREKFYQEGYLVAQNYLPKETALSYCHFSKTNDLPTQSFSFLGISHAIDLNLYPFVLQKKAKPFFSYLEEGHLEEGILQFMELVAKRISLGIQDQDHEIEANFGVIDHEVVQIDPGRLSLTQNLEKPKSNEEEWWSTTHRLKKWLLKNHPEKVAYFETIYTNLQKK